MTFCFVITIGGGVGGVIYNKHTGHLITTDIFKIFLIK